MAILYRTNAQSRIFEETLRSMNIPYRIYGGLSFYQRKEIKDILAYLRIIVNPYDEEALRRIINYPARGIGDTTQKKLQVFAITNQMSVWDVLQREDWMKEAQISAATIKKLQKFKSLIDELISREADTPHTEELYAFCMSVIEKAASRPTCRLTKVPKASANRKTYRNCSTPSNCLKTSNRLKTKNNRYDWPIIWLRCHYLQTRSTMKTEMPKKCR